MYIYILSLYIYIYIQVYDRLGVVLKEVGESFYNPYIPTSIEKLNQVRNK